MNRLARVGLAVVVLLGAAGGISAAGIEATGNVDGLLTWRVGELAPGESNRQVVLFAYADSYGALTKRLAAARQWAATVTEPPVRQTDEPAPAIAWIRNELTDFALAGPGHFFWEGQRQTLASGQSGQLSRFGYYVHYRDGIERRCGTPINRKQPENLGIVQPIAAVDETQAIGIVESADGILRIRIRAMMMGRGPVVAVEFLITNRSTRPVADVRLSAYANLEAAHSHENDYGTLDALTDSLLLVDGPTKKCIAMAGLNRPASGHCGTWASQAPLESAAGISPDKWPQFAGIPKSAQTLLARTPRRSVPHETGANVTAGEPPTRDLTAEEARDALHADWLFQADGRPTVERCRQEIGWARELAERLALNSKTRDLTAELDALAKLNEQLAAMDPTVLAQKLYLKLRTIKRQIQFANPVVDFSQVLFIDNPYPAGAEWPHQARHRNGMMAVPGGRLLVLDGLHPGGHLRKLAPSEPGSFWRPDVSFDGRRVLFCYKAQDEGSFHLYEIDLDGSGLRQLTSGDYDDIDPIYLPDGHILFSTTRCNTYVRCMPYTYSYVLARCDADGRNVYLVSRNNEPDWCPSLLNDGRICYSRWEYHDKALWRIQSLWTINQDGTNVATFWGNQSVWPDHLAEPRPIPGSNRVMFTGVAHHDWFAGSIGILDPDEGFNFPHGLTKVTGDVAWPECGQPPSDPRETEDYHGSGRIAAYKTPYPLSGEDFLVSARTGGRMDPFKLYLMDVHGNRELIYAGRYNVFHAMPAVARTRPPQHPDKVVWPGTGKDRQPPEPGILYSADVVAGVPDLPREKVKFLRVIQMDNKTYSTWTRDVGPNLFSGPAISIIQAEGVKRILGTVPVRPDGSVSVRVPAGRVLHFQLLDEKYRAVHTMRSFTGVMPGERRGCVGCHEQHSAAPAAGTGFALKEAPVDLTPPPWGAVSISYERHVQPLLDRHCGDCHQGDGEARADFDLTLRPGRGVFKEPYVSLIGHAFYDAAGKPKDAPNVAGALMAENYDQRDPASYKTIGPMRHLSHTSRLVQLCGDGTHYDTRMSPDELRQIIGWVDANCPYRGDEDVRAIPDPDFAGIEQLPVRPRTKTAPDIPRP